MEILLEQINQVIDILEQIKSITLNQQTIILQTDTKLDEMNMLEEMATYKNTLMLTVEEMEQNFEQNFNRYKGQISQHEKMSLLKEKVAYVIALKEEIVLGEKKNLLMLQDQLKKKIDKVELPKNAQKVANAYQKHGKTTGKG